MPKYPLHENALLTLDKLRKGISFRVIAEHRFTDGSLVKEGVYLLTSAMTDSGRTFLVEQIGGPGPLRGARGRPEIRIPREQARGIAVYMLRQP